jgi:hypothetical protein
MSLSAWGATSQFQWKPKTASSSIHPHNLPFNEKRRRSGMNGRKEKPGYA